MAKTFSNENKIEVVAEQIFKTKPAGFYLKGIEELPDNANNVEYRNE